MATQGVAIPDFGATATDRVTLTVAAAWVASGTDIEAYFMAEASADNGIDAHIMAPLLMQAVCGNKVAGVSFDLYLSTPYGASGKWNVRYVGN